MKNTVKNTNKGEVVRKYARPTAFMLEIKRRSLGSVIRFFNLTISILPVFRLSYAQTISAT